ncbi:MAG: aminopeptidase [Spirochaetes bacterium]|nr:aminopeptidase [Spirochaetota bacterium]
MSDESKSAGQKLADELFFNPKNCWETIEAQEEKKIEDFAKPYIDFLNNGKTERECVAFAVELLEKHGFVNIEQAAQGQLKSGAKVYQNIRGKALVAAVIGKQPGEGFNIIGAHIDSPRLDLKPNPVYEESGFVLLDTHYYGGVKKYQWTAVPLAMHGVFVKENGEKINVKIGESPDDPVFTITDLLPHLGKAQMEKKASELIEGEALDILAGSRPYNDKEAKEKVKLMMLSILHEKYGIKEKDFAGAEIEFVPAHPAREVGFDRSMIGAYGHDDRCCAWPALMALLSFATAPGEKTAVCYLSDKEETGSGGNTGANSYGFKHFLSQLCAASGRAGEAELRACLARSSMLSADVCAAYDPAFSDVFDKKNSSFMGKGLVLTKYNGVGGKYSTSDANAEFCVKVQGIMDRNNINWQIGLMGKVDKGGSGTIALFAANLGIEVLDCGMAVLSMHSPFEVISKIDLYTTYKGYTAFFRDA